MPSSRRTIQSRIAIAIALCATLLTTHTHSASAQSLSTHDHTDTLARLNSPHYNDRDSATRTLLADENLTVDQVITLYKNAASIEQRHRLLSVARHTLVRQLCLENFPQDRDGSVGIRPVGLSADNHLQPYYHNRGRIPTPHTASSTAPKTASPTASPSNLSTASGPYPPAILVDMTFDGFPAHARLRVGDLITSINGQPFPNLPDNDITKHFTNMVKSKTTGQSLTFTVLREGRPIDVTIKLASLQALKETYADPSTRRLTPIFDSQWQALRNHLTNMNPPQTLRLDANPS